MNPKLRIGNVTAILLILMAIGFDFLQFLVTFIPVLDVVLDFFIGVLAWITFLITFLLINPSLLSIVPKSGTSREGLVKNFYGAARWLGIGASSIVEIIPFFDALPALTLGVVSTIILSRIEDVGVTPSSIGEGIALAVSARKRNEAFRKMMGVQDMNNANNMTIAQEAKAKREAEMARLARNRARFEESLG